MRILTLRQNLVNAHPSIGMLFEFIQKLVGCDHLSAKKSSISNQKLRGIEKGLFMLSLRPDTYLLLILRITVEVVDNLVIRMQPLIIEGHGPIDQHVHAHFKFI